MRSQKQIAKRAITIKAKIAELYEEMGELQYECKHPNVSKTAQSDTGNWDKSQDIYWYHCVCPDCGKVWTEDQ